MALAFVNFVDAGSRAGVGDKVQNEVCLHADFGA